MSDLSLTLYDIESQLAQLVTMREEAADDLERQVIDEQIAEYLRAEIKKTDNIIPLLRNWEALALARKTEAARLIESAKVVTNRIDRLKEMIKTVMQSMPWPEGKPRKLEGTTGTLLLKANGGRAAVTVTDVSMVPVEFCDYRGFITGKAWSKILSIGDAHGFDFSEWEGVQLEKIPRVGSMLANGEAVPGCRLEPKGEHIEIR